MIELLVTIVLAGIIFAAMVPVFASALKRTSGDGVRVIENNIAQDRLEQVRLLDFEDITEANLNYPPSPFGDERFGLTYDVAGSSKPYDMRYWVVLQANAQKVTVRVTAPGSNVSTTLDTIVKDPAAGTLLATTGGTPSPLPSIAGLSIKVSFKNWNDVTGTGHYVTVKRVLMSGSPTPTPIATFTPTPAQTYPSSSSPVEWTDSPVGNLTGGMDYIYTVTCYGKNGTATCPEFHLLGSASIRFDTNPGGP
jgi:type II secretory pathway pseudopilin PulG